MTGYSTLTRSVARQTNLSSCQCGVAGVLKVSQALSCCGVDTQSVALDRFLSDFSRYRSTETNKSSDQKQRVTVYEDKEATASNPKEPTGDESILQKVSTALKQTVLEAGMIGTMVKDSFTSVAGQVAGTVMGSKPDDFTDTYKKMRGGGGAAHELQEQAPKDMRDKDTIEDRYPRQVEAAALQNMKGIDMPRMRESMVDDPRQRKPENEESNAPKPN